MDPMPLTYGADTLSVQRALGGGRQWRGERRPHPEGALPQLPVPQAQSDSGPKPHKDVHAGHASEKRGCSPATVNSFGQQKQATIQETAEREQLHPPASVIPLSLLKMTL